MKISIIIPVYGKSNFTRSCLSDLSYLNRETHEIIVVDNASPDNTKEIITKEFPWVNYIRNDTNEYFAKAVNKGFALSTGNIVIFLNNDIRIKKDLNCWTWYIASEIQSYPNSIIGINGGYVDDNTLQFKYETKDPAKSINYIAGWFLAADRETLLKLKIDEGTCPFDTRFLFYHEDTDLGFRAKQLGIELRLIRDIDIVHFGKITAGTNTGKLFVDSRKIFIDKWLNNKATNNG